MNDKPKRTSKRQSTHRFRALNLFVDETMRGLEPAVVAVWLVLFRCARPDGFARVGIGGIVTRTGLSKSTVKRAIGKLKQLGMLKTVTRGRAGRGVSAYLILPFPYPSTGGTDGNP
jgi:DNA-binding MarR family transcriptional regulator